MYAKSRWREEEKSVDASLRSRGEMPPLARLSQWRFRELRRQEAQ